MERKLVAHYLTGGNFARYEKLRPTGRWKLQYGATAFPDKEPVMFIEHRKFWGFNVWIDESYIKFFFESKEIVFNCKEKL